MTVGELLRRVRALLAPVPLLERPALTDAASLACLLAEQGEWAAAEVELRRAATLAAPGSRSGWQRLIAGVVAGPQDGRSRAG